MKDSIDLTVTTSFVFLAAELKPGPPVTNAGLAPVGPWSTFLTWDQPDGVDSDDLEAYRLNFTNFAVLVPATDKLMMHLQDTGIEPNTAVIVAITVVYKSMAPSKPLYRKCHVPPASKLLHCV